MKFLRYVLDNASAWVIALITTAAFCFMAIYHKEKDYKAGYNHGKQDAIEAMQDYVNSKP